LSVNKKLSYEIITLVQKWSPTGKARGTSIEIPSYACLREAPPPEALRGAGAPAKAGQGFGGLSTGGEIHRSIKF